MKIKSLIDSINESKKETKTGVVHKSEPGGYGRKVDVNKPEANKDAPAIKKGRGRPKKDADSETGEVKKWDTDTLQRWIVGSKPKTLPGKASVKHKMKDESVAESSNKLQGTPVVSLSDFDDGKDTKKDKYGRKVPNKLEKDDPRVKFHTEPAKKQDVEEGRWVTPKAAKPPKSPSTVSLNQLEKNKKENPGQSPFKTQDEKVKKYLGLKEPGVAEGLVNEGQYEMMMRNGQVKKFIAKDDADAKRIAAGHGAKSVIKLKGGVPAGKVAEQGVAEGSSGDVTVVFCEGLWNDYGLSYNTFEEANAVAKEKNDKDKAKNGDSRDHHYAAARKKGKYVVLHGEVDGYTEEEFPSLEAVYQYMNEYHNDHPDHMISIHSIQSSSDQDLAEGLGDNETEVIEKYKGWTFTINTQTEDDRYVKFYSAISPDGEEHQLSKHTTADQFKQFVDKQSVAEGSKHASRPGTKGRPGSAEQAQAGVDRKRQFKADSEKRRAEAEKNKGQGVVEGWRQDQYKKRGINSIMDLVKPAMQEKNSVDGWIDSIYTYIEDHDMKNDPKWLKAKSDAEKMHTAWFVKNNMPTANTNPKLARQGDVMKYKALIQNLAKEFGEQGVAEGSNMNVVKSVKVGNFRHDLVDLGFGWQVRIYNGDEIYDTGLNKNSEQKGLAALDNAVAYTKKLLNIKEQGVAEGKDKHGDGKELYVGIEAYGVKGMKSTPWRKRFKSQAAYDKWEDDRPKDDGIEVHGTREVDLNNSSIKEEKKETKTGVVHKAEKGGYGRKVDINKPEDKKAEPAVKRGRGRPKKDADSDTGEVKKWDTDKLSSWIIGNKPKTLPGKPGVKHKLKDWIEHVEAEMIVESQLGISMKPVQSGAQEITLGDKSIGIASSAQAANQLKQSIEKGDLTLNTDANIKEENIEEVAPEGWEGTVKAMKKHSDEIDNPWALAHWMKNKGYKSHKKESVNETSIDEKLKDLLDNYPYEHKNAQEGWGMHDNFYHALCDHYWKQGRIPRDVMYGSAEGLRSYVEECYTEDTAVSMEEGVIGAALGGVAGAAITKSPSGAMTGANLGSSIEDTLFDDEIEEDARTVAANKIRTPAVFRKNDPLTLSDVGVEPKFVKKGEQSDADKYWAIHDEPLARANQAEELPESELEKTLRASIAEMEDYMSESKVNEKYMGHKKLSSELKSKGASDPEALASWIGRKKYGKEKFQKAAAAGKKLGETSSIDAQMESWEKDLNTLLSEGLTVTTSTGQKGVGDSVSVNATDEHAQNLLQILQHAGITNGVVSSDDAEAATVEPISSDDVMTQLSSEKVDDSGDESLSFLKKMLSLRNPETQSQHSDSESLEEEDMEEGNKFTGELAKAREQGKKEADLDGDGEMEKVQPANEDEETCNECGMMESKCECSHESAPEELNEWANTPCGDTDDTGFKTELEYMTKLISGGINSIKKDQTVLPSTKVVADMNENISFSMKKLAGIK